MSTDLEQRLRDALHEDAERARLVNPNEPPALGTMRLSNVDERRWSTRTVVAVAAVIVLVALAAALTLFGDDQKVDTVPVTTETTRPAPDPETRPLPRPSVEVLDGRTIVSGAGCPFGISGDAVDLELGPAAERFDVEGGQGVAHLEVGSLTAEVYVPAYELQDEEGWHFEPVEVGGRSATETAAARFSSTVPPSTVTMKELQGASPSGT